MKVNGHNPPEHQNISQGPQRVARAEGKEEVAQAAKPQSTDRIEISQKAKEVMRLKELIRELPEVREDRVAALQQAIQTGNYKVDALNVAKKMLGE
jgi:negative regulator of flagellin synthesis FlgM